MQNTKNITPEQLDRLGFTKLNDNTFQLEKFKVHTTVNIITENDKLISDDITFDNVLDVIDKLLTEIEIECPTCEGQGRYEYNFGPELKVADCHECEERGILTFQTYEGQWYDWMDNGYI